MLSIFSASIKPLRLERAVSRNINHLLRIFYQCHNKPRQFILFDVRAYYWPNSWVKSILSQQISTARTQPSNVDIRTTSLYSLYTFFELSYAQLPFSYLYAQVPFLFSYPYTRQVFQFPYAKVIISIRKRLRHRWLVRTRSFWSKFSNFSTSKSEFFNVFLKFLMVGMESAPSKTSRAPKIVMFDNCMLDF